MIRPLAFALACSLALPVVAGPAAAQEPPRPAPKLETLPDALGRAALEALMHALAQAISQVPQYGVPEFTDRGDIIIRRLNPRSATPRPAPRPRPPVDMHELST